MGRLEEARRRIIVPLDVQTTNEAVRIVQLLSANVNLFKVGLELYTAAGPQAVKMLMALGANVFLDLKFGDIPNTVGGAAKSAAALGVEMFNVHAWCGRAAMEAAVANRGGSLVLAVTVLTSMKDANIAELGISTEIPELVRAMAKTAKAAGVNGVICSPQELSILNTDPELRLLLKVIPGVRPAGADTQDQARVMTPGDAIRAGADYLVIGRPIIDAANPVVAAEEIAEEIAEAMSTPKGGE